MKTCPRCNLRYPDDAESCFVDGAALGAARDKFVGTTLAGRYVIEHAIASGGMATVYRAKHRLANQLCAVKIMGESFARNSTARERFSREAKATQQLNHPNIIEIYELGETADGLPFMAMELLEGQTLAESIKAGVMSLGDSVMVLLQLASALARAHDFDVVHRDLKPENVFLLKSGDGRPHAKLLDFGIARCLQAPRLTNVGEVLGTPQYVAPERLVGRDAAASSDLFSLGVIAFQMLSSRLPFEGNDSHTYLMNLLTKSAPSLASAGASVPARLETMVASLLQKTPEQRPVDAHRVVAELAEISKDLGLPLPPAIETIPPKAAASPRSNTLPGDDLWQQRISIFSRMLGAAWSNNPPGFVSLQLDQIQRQSQVLAQALDASSKHNNDLEQLKRREQQDCSRLGRAADVLGNDVSRAREQARQARTMCQQLDAENALHKQTAATLHTAMCGLISQIDTSGPTPELSQACRAIATEIDAWCAGNATAQQCRQATLHAESAATDLEFQIKELRTRRDRVRESIELQHSQLQAQLTAVVQQADQLEQQLTQLSSSLCSALRSRPELHALFAELEKLG